MEENKRTEDKPKITECRTRIKEENPVAIKVLQPKRLNADLKRRIRAEVDILRLLQSRHVVRLHDAFFEEEAICIVMEYCEGGDLGQRIQKYGPLKEEIAIRLFSQILEGMKVLHENRIMHRDLKPANLLLTSKDLSSAEIKISDFGFARVLEETNLASTLCGTPMYLAPEVLQRHPYDASVDVWSLGIILHEMVFGSLPFPANNIDELLALTSRGFSSENPKREKKKRISQQLFHLIRRMLRSSPSKRISWCDLCNHALFSKKDDKEDGGEYEKRMKTNDEMEEEKEEEKEEEEKEEEEKEEEEKREEFLSTSRKREESENILEEKRCIQFHSFIPSVANKAEGSRSFSEPVAVDTEEEPLPLESSLRLSKFSVPENPVVASSCPLFKRGPSFILKMEEKSIENKEHSSMWVGGGAESDEEGKEERCKVIETLGEKDPLTSIVAASCPPHLSSLFAAPVPPVDRSMNYSSPSSSSNTEEKMVSFPNRILPPLLSSAHPPPPLSVCQMFRSNRIPVHLQPSSFLLPILSKPRILVHAGVKVHQLTTMIRKDMEKSIHASASIVLFAIEKIHFLRTKIFLCLPAQTIADLFARFGDKSGILEIEYGVENIFG